MMKCGFVPDGEQEACGADGSVFVTVDNEELIYCPEHAQLLGFCASCGVLDEADGYHIRSFGICESCYEQLLEAWS